MLYLCSLIKHILDFHISLFLYFNCSWEFTYYCNFTILSICFGLVNKYLISIDKRTKILSIKLWRKSKFYCLNGWIIHCDIKVSSISIINIKSQSIFHIWSSQFIWIVYSNLIWCREVSICFNIYIYVEFRICA